MVTISGNVTRQPKTDPDSELVRLAANGDVDAFGELVARHERAVYSVISRMALCRDDVDDLAQDAFVLAYRSIGSFRGESSFATWLYSIAVNTTLKSLKRGKRRQALSLDDPDIALGETLVTTDQPDPAEAAHARDRNRRVRQAIDTLPEKQKVVVLLHYFEDRTCEEIAKILHCSVGTVWSRLHYACKKLRGQLEWLGSEG